MDINDRGEVLVWAETTIGIWRDGEFYDWYAQATPGSLQSMTTIFALNNHGQVAGSAGIWGLTLHTPTTRASVADINGDCAVNAGDLLTVIAGWGPCDRGQPCPADVASAASSPITGKPDGAVGVADLLFVISNWR